MKRNYLSSEHTYLIKTHKERTRGKEGEREKKGGGEEQNSVRLERR